MFPAETNVPFLFSRTALAKEFRRWVLDVLDRETAAHPPPSPC
ncbi:BRO-N domain-containing protein [Aeromonas caviae]